MSVFRSHLVGDGQSVSPQSGVQNSEAEGNWLKDRVHRYERGLILTALELTDWRQTSAAPLLGVLRSTLSEKMKRHGLRKSRRGDVVAIAPEPPQHFPNARRPRAPRTKARAESRPVAAMPLHGTFGRTKVR